MKYVRFEGYGFITWPNTDKIWHSQMVYAFQNKLNQPISAGFIRMTDEGPECYGYSSSLNLHSLPEDTALFQAQFSLD